MPCYGTGPAGDIMRTLRGNVRWLRRLAGGVLDYRCTACRGRYRVFALTGPPDACPDCGRETGACWHEITEG